MKVKLWFVVISAALLFLPATTQADRRAQPGLGKQPAGMDAQIDFRLENNLRGFNIYFSNDVVTDKNLIFKDLGQDERPFRLSPPVESKCFWKDARTLRVELLVTAPEFERLLERGPLEIRWNKDFKSLKGRTLADIHPGSGFLRTDFTLESRVDKRGQLISSVKSREFTVAIDTSADYQSVNLRLHFNRLMVPREKWNKRMTLDEAPFTLTPELPLTGRWTDERTLIYEASFSRKDFWEKVSDLPFTLKWKKDFETLDGESVAKAAITNLEAKVRDLARPFYFSRFAVSGLAQTGLDLEGRVELDLMFNKPVQAEDLKGRLKGEVRQASVWNAKTRQDEEIYGPLEIELAGVGGTTDPDNTVARLKLKAIPDQQIRVTVDGVRSADGKGRLAESASLGLTVNDYFAVRGAELRIEKSYPWKPYFSIEIQEPLIFEGIEKFIKLEPALPFTVSPYGQSGKSIQIFAPFDAETPVKITLLPGLKSQRGILLKEIVYDAKISPKSDRRLIFTGRGRYLSPEKPLLIKIAGRNADKVRLQGWRVYENNLAAIINTQEYDASLRTRLAVQFSDNLLDKNTRTWAKAGETFERLLDLKQLLNENPKGAYLLKISRIDDEDEDDENDENGYYYYNRYDYHDYYYHPERYLPVMISDLGLSARVLPGQSSVMVASLSQAGPVAGATVKFYDMANQVIAQGTTDKDGLSRADIAAGRSAFLTVEKDGDLNYLNLASSSRSSYGDDDYNDYEYHANQWREDRDSKWFGGEGGWLAVETPDSQGPMRDYLTRGYEAFLFMPRDIFKPGETVPVKAIIRDRDIAPPASPFPVIWRLIDPDGRTLGQGRAEMSKNGGLDFQAEIPFSARTGSWEAAIYLPEASAPMGRVKFTVEDFVPPRLAIELAPVNKAYAESNPEIGVTADVKYLFGAPGVGLKWELDAVISPSAWRPEGWNGFDFAGPPSDFQTTRQKRVKRGELDEQGQARITFKPDLAEKRLPNRMNVEMVVSVQEDGGRWNAKKVNVDYFPRPLILGSRAPKTAVPGHSFDYEVAALTPEAKPADVARLAVELFQVNTRYYNSYRYGRNYRQSMEELEPKAEKMVNLKDGRGKFAFVPEAAGIYEVKITDPESGLTVRRRVWVYGLETAQEKTAKDLVQISFDKKNYRPGDTAKVKIKSPFPGRLWLTVDTDRPVFSETLDLRGTETVMEIPVTADIKTNAQVAASVVRPLAEGETGYRALGVASLEIDREIYRLKVEADIPGHVKPSSKTKLTVKLSDDQGRPMAGEATVSLVDEGVLSLTGFKAPDPWRMFTAGRHLLTRFYDLYELLLPVEKAAVPFLAPGGGDGIGRSGLFSPFKRNQEILSIFLAAVTVDESGEAQVELNLPEYSGQGRLMVVAAGGSRFGTARRDIKISRDLTAEVTLPLALAPGDSFEIPVRAFLSAEAKAEAGQGAVFRFKTEGPIRLLENTEGTFNLTPGDGETRLLKAVAEPAENGDQAGIGRLIIESENGLGEVFSQTLETAVRPPYPRVSLTESQAAEETETTITVPVRSFLKGTVESSLTIARHPAIEAARAIRYLSSYPYGCLEQTTSQAWTFAAAGDILTGLEPTDNQAHHIKQGLEAAVRRLATMQTAQGGFGYWPGDSHVYEWGSVYAIHFLTEAGRKIELPNGLMERSLRWLNSYLGATYNGSSSDMSYILSTRAYACYVLALNGQYPVGWVNALKDRHEGLSPSGRIFLAGAEAIRDGNPKALKALEVKDFDLSIDTRAYRISSLESRPRNLALKLLAWVEVDPLSDKTRELALAVVEEGRNGRWRNTQENGLAVLALGNYLAKSAVGRPYTATVLDNDGRTLLTAGPADTVSVGPKAMAAVQDKPLVLKIEGEGRPYWNLTVAAVPIEAPAPKAEGLTLTRTWIMAEGAEHPLSTPEETAEAIHVAKGDRVTVVLTVKAKEALQNIVLADLLPGGFEIENPRLISEAESADPDNGDDGHVYGSRLEIREDRLIIIEPWLSSNGEAVYRYTMRAVTPGEYILPPTAAEGMYEPDKQAVTAGGKVIVGN